MTRTSPRAVAAEARVGTISGMTSRTSLPATAGEFLRQADALVVEVLGSTEAGGMVAYLAERQLGLLLSPSTNGDLPPMLTPRAGRGCGLAGSRSAPRPSCRGSGSWSTRRR